MKVAEVMRSPVPTVDADEMVVDAIATLVDGGLSALPVVDGQGRLAGVLSATDVLAVTAESDPERRAELLDELPVEMLMSRRALAIAPDAELQEAARQLLQGSVHRLFVVEHGRPVGVVSPTEVVRAFATR